MSHPPISIRITQPTPEEVRAGRIDAGLTQAEAAQLVSTAQTRPYRTWQGYEVPHGQKDHRAIPLATWELFLLLTDRHPSLSLTTKE